MCACVSVCVCECVHWAKGEQQFGIILTILTYLLLKQNYHYIFLSDCKLSYFFSKWYPACRSLFMKNGRYRGTLVQSPNNDSHTKPKDKYSLWNGTCKQTSWPKQTDRMERKHLGEFRFVWLTGQIIFGLQLGRLQGHWHHGTMACYH